MEVCKNVARDDVILVSRVGVVLLDGCAFLVLQIEFFEDFRSGNHEVVVEKFGAKRDVGFFFGSHKLEGRLGVAFTFG